MSLIFRYMKPYMKMIIFAIVVKLLGTLSELMLPTILEHIIDEVVPAGRISSVLLWGSLMFLTAVLCRQLNVIANRKAIDNAHHVSRQVRQDLFEKTINLGGSQFDELGLPSLISRMTSDSYNVQSAVQRLQSLCVRAPMMLIGGIIVAAMMDLYLTTVLIVMLPILTALIIFISLKGIPMYTAVQAKLDEVVRIMRENITGIRVVKALSKENAERSRFAQANADMTKSDISAAAVMAVPGPLMQLCLNTGLSIVVFLGAQRVNAGYLKPGVILAFLTYFNMITMGVMGLSRIFVTMSKASASAERIREVLEKEPEESGGYESEEVSGDFICFDNVDFSYGKGSGRAEDFAGEEREKALSGISFSMKKGESLGIIGPTGCGKSTIVQLLMRFYTADAGTVSVNGKDVRSYQKDELRHMFGTVFQNDMIFMDTLYENIDFGRKLSRESINAAVHDSMAERFVSELDEGLQYMAAIKGSNLSGGQKQRIYISRALAGDPEILILDDSSSALDYRTDAEMRRAVRQRHPDTTMIMIAQRISSVMNMDRILVLDNGKCIGLGDHKTLMKTCRSYRETYEIQMGSMMG